MIGGEPICYKCSRKFVGQLACQAYPDGIPDDIIDGEVEHTRPLPYDGGLQYAEGLPRLRKYGDDVSDVRQSK